MVATDSLFEHAQLVSDFFCRRGYGELDEAKKRSIGMERERSSLIPVERVEHLEHVERVEHVQSGMQMIASEIVVRNERCRLILATVDCP